MTDRGDDHIITIVVNIDNSAGIVDKPMTAGFADIIPFIPILAAGRLFIRHLCHITESMTGGGNDNAVMIGDLKRSRRVFKHHAAFTNIIFGISVFAASLFFGGNMRQMILVRSDIRHFSAHFTGFPMIIVVCGIFILINMGMFLSRMTGLPMADPVAAL